MSQAPSSHALSPESLEPPKRALLTIFFIVFMDLFGFGVIIPLLPFYVHDPDSNPLKVSLLFAIYSICQFIAAPILGMISDRFGRKPVLALSQAGSVLGYVLLGVAVQFDWSNAGMTLALVYASRIIDGLSGGNISTAQAYISDVTTPKNRARGMGLLGAAFGLGFAFGPFVGGVLGKGPGNIHAYRPAYFAAALSFAAMLMSIFWLVESPRHLTTEAEAWLHPAKFAPIFRKPVLMQLLLISFVAMAGFVMMETTVGIYLIKHYHYDQEGVGWFFCYLGLLIALVQGGLIRRVTRKIGEWLPAIAGVLIVAAGMAGFMATARFPTLGMLALAGALTAVGRSFQQPTLSSLISQFSRRSEQGTVFGLYHGMGSIARVVGPLVAAGLYAYLNNTGPFLMAGFLALACGLWMATLRHNKPVEEEPDLTGESLVEIV